MQFFCPGLNFLGYVPFWERFPQYGLHCQPSRSGPSKSGIYLWHHECLWQFARLVKKSCINSFFFLLKGVMSNFWMAIFLLLITQFAKGFHAFGSATNPLDIAPKHAGAVSGMSMCLASTAGQKLQFLCQYFSTVQYSIQISLFNVIDNAISLITGFLGVYLAGYILDITGSWSAVFNATAVINFFGIAVFIIFGSGTPII